MGYRSDQDLEFLSNVESYHLDILVSYLIKDKDGSTRLTEELTGRELYKKNVPNHHAYWKLIAAELQCFGANTWMTLLRGGKGVLYREVLTDVCNYMNVCYDKKATVDQIERSLIFCIIQKSLNEMSQEELEAIVKELDFDFLSREHINFTTVFSAIQESIKINGDTAYKMAFTVANATANVILGRGISLVNNAGLSRSIGLFANPIKLLIDIAGPAYRVTVPSVIHVAYLRLLYKDRQM